MTKGKTPKVTVESLLAAEAEKADRRTCDHEAYQHGCSFFSLDPAPPVEWSNIPKEQPPLTEAEFERLKQKFLHQDDGATLTGHVAPVPLELARRLERDEDG